MAVETGFQGRTVDVQKPRTSGPRTAHPGATADAVFADAKAFLSSSEARQMSESELERELHRRGQRLVRKLLQEHHDQRSPGETAGPAEDASDAECSEPRVQESHTETTSDARYHGLHPLDAASNPLPERNLFEMRRVTIATAARAPPRTPWKPPWRSTSSRGGSSKGPSARCARLPVLKPPRAGGVFDATETPRSAREVPAPPAAIAGSPRTVGHRSSSPLSSLPHYDHALTDPTVSPPQKRVWPSTKKSRTQTTWRPTAVWTTYCVECQTQADA